MLSMKKVTIPGGKLAVFHNRKPCKTAEPIEISFGAWTCGDSRYTMFI